ncbi:hypothetical protein PS854_05511 [Pseudomonas fluorescens]|uniref:Uncharacterized protein n=1 Tax=Pseudomonas fluorescens TaxID=294 RepID=A0A5E7PWQ5_PSEFL|nr:hypothetical protein PS854_05511 [Pseudomonas fluorescens]
MWLHRFKIMQAKRAEQLSGHKEVSKFTQGYVT